MRVPQVLRPAVVVMAVLTATVGGAAEAAPITVNYFGTGETLSVPSLDRGGITVTGSSNVTLQPLGALGIAGGENTRVDGFSNPPEYVEFTFNSGAATDVSWTIAAASAGANTLLGEATVEAWDHEGNYLGSGTTASTSVIKTLDIYFGEATIYSRFRMTSARFASFAVGSVTYVPEPTAAALLLTPAALLLRRRRCV